MTFNHINRRLHLYLALALLPWIFLYGISAIPFTRNETFNKLYEDGVPQWIMRFERPYDRPTPDGNDEAVLRPFAKQVIDDLGLTVKGAYGAYRPNKHQIIIYVHDFFNDTRATYDIEKHHITIEDKRFRWDQFFTSLHARGGYHQDGILNDLWALIIDIVCIGFVLWVASGIVMWWQLKQTRIWGFVALCGGVLSFAIFLMTL